MGTLLYIIFLIWRYQQSICGKHTATYESIFNAAEYAFSYLDILTNPKSGNFEDV